MILVKIKLLCGRGGVLHLVQNLIIRISSVLLQISQVYAALKIYLFVSRCHDEHRAFLLVDFALD